MRKICILRDLMHCTRQMIQLLVKPNLLAFFIAFVGFIRKTKRSCLYVSEDMALMEAMTT